MTRRVILVALLALSLVVVGFVGASAQRKPFEGVTLVVGGESGLTINPVKWHRDAFRELTGAQIQVVEHPFGNLFEKYMTSFITGTQAYDVIIFPSAWSGDIMGGEFLMDLTPRIPQLDDWNDVIPVYRERIAAWGNKVYAVPVDGDSHMLYYRKDLIENPEYQRRFKQQFGYDLGPPRTWKMYKDIAKFFTGWDWDGDGQPNYGVVESMGRKGQSYWWFFTHSAAYVAYPGTVGRLFFDVETMEPLVNSPGHVQGLTDYVEMVKYGPPGMINYQVGDVRSEFPAGVSALAIDWGDVGTIANDPKQSKIVGKAGYAMLPGSERVWNPKTRAWETLGEPNYAPYLAFGGWVAGVPANSPKREAGFAFLKYLNSKEVSLKDVTTGGSGYNPYRFSHFDAIARWRDFGFDRPEEYLDAIRTGIAHPNAQLDLRIPGAAEYFDVLDLYLSRALAGELTPKQALDAVAAEWNRITDRLGRKQQLNFYRQSLGLPPK